MIQLSRYVPWATRRGLPAALLCDTFSRCLLALGFLLVGVSTWGQDSDTVVLRVGSPVRGKVERTSNQSVYLDVNGQQREIPANQIRYVAFAGEPSSLRQLREAAAAGQIERAERHIEILKRQTFDRDLIQADLKYYEALTAKHKALATGEGLAEAARAMRDFVTAYRDTFHFYDAAEVLGDLAVALQRPDDAAKFYGLMEKAPWVEVQFRGTVRMADALRAVGGDRLRDALERYETILATDMDTEDGERQKKKAAIGKAVCQAEMGQVAEAEPVIEQLIQEAPVNDHELLALAYNALGTCHLAADRPKDALLAFLHVDLLFAAETQARAEALYFIGQLWDQLGHQDRAVEARQALRDNFEGSIWAKKLAAASDS